MTPTAIRMEVYVHSLPLINQEPQPASAHQKEFTTATVRAAHCGLLLNQEASLETPILAQL
jgi:hypothetical protein